MNLRTPGPIPVPLEVAEAGAAAMINHRGPEFADLIADLCKLLRNNNWLANNAIIYFEQGKDHVKPVLVDDWLITHEKIAGKVSYSLVQTRT